MSQASRMRMRQAEVLRCPFCHDEVAPAPSAATCRGCNAVHHAACWSEHGACAACRSRSKIQPRPPVGARRSGGGWLRQLVREMAAARNG